MMFPEDHFVDSFMLFNAANFAWRWTRRIVVLIALMLLCSCSYTNCTFTTVKLDAGGEMTADIAQSPKDDSTQGAVTATKTVSPTTTATGIPGM